MARILQTDAHGGCGGQRRERDAQDGHCAQKLHGRNEVDALNRLLRGSRPEDEDRHGEWQVQHREQHAAAADAKRQRRTDSAQ